MSLEETIKRLFEKSNVKVGSQVDDRILGGALDKLDFVESTMTGQNIWRIIMKSKIPRFGAVAAGLLIGLFLWFLIAAPTNITLADVQKSINSKTWILIEYEDGRKEWYNLNEKKSFSASVDKNGGNYCRSMRDHVNGLQRTYHSNWGYQIHEFSFTPKPFPQTPWEYVLSGWDDKGVGKSIPETVEKFSDLANWME